VSKVVSNPTVPLPTKSWRALLEDANPDSDEASAKPQLQKASGGSQIATPPALPQLTNPGGRNGMTIHTEAYMQLLKEGGRQKKNDGSSSLWRHKPQASGGDMCQTVASSSASFLTAAGLKQKWDSALSQGATCERSKEVPIDKVVHDDMQLEKFKTDEDTADPAYWSESETTDRRHKASAHRLGRRQRMVPRSYVMQDLSLVVDRAVAMMLAQLQLFGTQQQTFTLANIPQPQRRFVIGIKEVARRIKQLKVSCLIVAPDLEKDSTKGGLDDRVREVLALSYEKRIPVIFALSRKGLGRALGKDMTISVIGILDATGAQDLLKTAVQISDGARQAWLARLPG